LPEIESNCDELSGGHLNMIRHTVVSELTPVAQRGALLAFGTAIVTSATLLAPYIMGSVVETAASPLVGFIICGVIMLVVGRNPYAVQLVE